MSPEASPQNPRSETGRRRRGALQSVWLRRGIDVLDLQPVLEAQGSPLSYYFAHDEHWTAGGHALVAQAISQHLAR